MQRLRRASREDIHVSHLLIGGLNVRSGFEDVQVVAEPGVCYPYLAVSSRNNYVIGSAAAKPRLVEQLHGIGY
jgi:hypothetical protein